ncbi:MAG: MarR family transcriptional regulator [Parasphingorhabdus sp.]|jgi:DNA-binding MarR family transcriptional regulator|nr:MarR family transcriptional regulator [Parasphingorhabdus sp.]|tara:strand:- start:575 stop:1024 length:450 start_codon:yes stop_codon:yes gene_type:complete
MSEAIGFLIHDTARLFRRELNERMRHSGVTALQWRLLAYLARNEGTNQVKLAEFLEVEPITLSRMIDRLADAGMLSRRRDPDDRRAWRLYLEEQSLPLIVELRAASAKLTEAAQEGLTTEEREQLASLVERMRQNLSRKACDATQEQAA